MGLENYKPTLWENAIIENFHDTSFVGSITTPPVEKKGEKVIFNRIQKGAWKTYTKGQKITWDSVATTKIEMDFPNEKYFAYMVEDVEQVQLKGDVLKAVTKEQSDVLGEEIDQELVSYIVTNVADENKIGATDSLQAVDAASAYDLLVDLNTKANKSKMPVTDRYFIISPDFLNLLTKDSRFTKEYKILQNGIVEGSNINGATLICKADNPNDKVILTHKSAIGYAMQLNGSPEAVRLIDYIGEGVRGLVKYGYTQLRPKGSFVAFISYS